MVGLGSGKMGCGYNVSVGLKKLRLYCLREVFVFVWLFLSESTKFLHVWGSVTVCWGFGLI